MLSCVGILPTTGYYWNTLEHIGTAWNLYDPIRTVLGSPGCALPPVPEMHSCTDVQLPPLSYNTLAFSRLLDTIGTHWNILEPPGTYTTLKEPSWILLDVPCTQYLKYKAALIGSYHPFHTMHSHALGTSRVCCHALAFSLRLDTSGTHWNILEPPGTYTTL